MMSRILNRIKEEYEAGELSYIDAIEELIIRCGMTALDAEVAVSDWEIDQ